MCPNPIASLIQDAERIQSSLAEDVRSLCAARDAVAQARQARQAAQELYEEAETEFLFSLIFENEQYSGCKNADQRQVVKDAALVKARQSGVLRQVWRTFNECRIAQDNATLKYDKAEDRFKAIRVAAELQAAMLIGATTDAKLLHQ
jgi:hypothetical protein